MKAMFQKFVPLVCLLALTACGGVDTKVVKDPDQPAYARTEITAGTGEVVANGDLVAIQYTGWLYDSSKTYSRGTQFETGSTGVTVGTGSAGTSLGSTGNVGTAVNLPGWDQALVGAKVGSKLNVVMPYMLAYGTVDYPSTAPVKVPAKTAVVFELVVTAVKKGTPSVAVTITETAAGTGAQIGYGKTVSVAYTGWLYDPVTGTKLAQFDTATAAKPISFVFGTTVITGWTRGMEGMKVGGKRTLIIPPELAYGLAGKPSVTVDNVASVAIPANATLIFDIELLSQK